MKHFNLYLGHEINNSRKKERNIFKTRFLTFRVQTVQRLDERKRNSSNVVPNKWWNNIFSTNTFIILVATRLEAVVLVLSIHRFGINIWYYVVFLIKMMYKKGKVANVSLQCFSYQNWRRNKKLIHTKAAEERFDLKKTNSKQKQVLAKWKF